MSEQDNFRTVVLLEGASGKSPFEEWYKKITDSKIRRSILVYITRLQNFDFTNFKSVGNEVFELRIFAGAGYRIYFAFEESTIVVILLGGKKSSQRKDIKKAQNYWKEYQNETQKNRKQFFI